MKKFILSTTFFACSISAMQPSQQSPVLPVYAVPGQNGLGSESDYIKGVLGKDTKIVKVATPERFRDLGQSFCERHMSEAFEKNDNKQGAIVYATSQGTATSLNYLADTDKGKKIKALILEATLASGNSAIYHTVTGPLMNMNICTKIPFSYYLLPYAANFFMPGYRPAGKQPIKSIDAIPTDIPIVIIHSKNDMQLSYDDACALYYGLRSKGNDNVYFIHKEDCGHVRILESEDERNIIKRVLKKHGLMVGILSVEEADLSAYQPDPMQYKAHYDDLIAKETRHTYIERSIGLGLLAGLIKYMSGY